MLSAFLNKMQPTALARNIRQMNTTVHSLELWGDQTWDGREVATNRAKIATFSYD
jgi:hypothetical protein